jgi:hypothetical protein
VFCFSFATVGNIVVTLALVYISFWINGVLYVLILHISGHENNISFKHEYNLGEATSGTGCILKLCLLYSEIGSEVCCIRLSGLQHKSGLLINSVL